MSAEQQSPVIGGYVVCGQYPGTVAPGATVSLQCSDASLPPVSATTARYVIVQFPITDQMNFCEIDVCAYGEWQRCMSVVIVMKKYC